jgi:hypothetical protein
MRFPWLILLLYVLLPLGALAQSGTITGTVTSSDSKKPLVRASVFLSNSSVGAITNEDGAFALYSIRPGQYTLVVSILGYEEYSKTILVGREPIKLNIELAQKPLMLREVVIASPADWKRNFEWFRRDFIGTDENARYCDVINPHILNIVYNQTKQKLTAKGEEFLVVENHALGYRIKFLVDSFSSDKLEGLISFGGQRLFEDLPGSDAQKAKWHEKREEVYYGSAMHFYRSLYQDKLDEAGFIVYPFWHELNPERPKEEELQQKLKLFQLQNRRDSFMYYRNLALLSKYYNEKLMRPPLKQFEILSHFNQPGLYVMHFNKYLYIVYTKKRELVPDSRDFYRPLDMANYEATIVTMQDDFPVFDSNGIVVANSALYEGSWANSRLSDMLPVDYVPDQK